jgi:parallel beta-helix repeat protein
MLAVAGAAAVLTGAAGAQAATTITCGQTITSSIKVANDPGPCTGSGLVVGHTNITIDLNGHSLIGDYTAVTGERGVDNTAGFDGVTVKHGTVQGFTDGIVLDGAAGNHLVNLHVSYSTGDGIRLQGSSDNTIATTTVGVSANEGIELGANSDSNLLDRVTASGNQNTNLWINSGSDKNLVVDGKFSKSALFYGVDIRASVENVIRGNRICTNAKDGVSIDGADGRVDRNSAKGNYLCDNRGNGVRVAGPASSNRIVGNTAFANDLSGIDIEGFAAGTLIKANKADQNDTGIDVNSGTTATKLKDNRARDNDSIGFAVSSTDFINAGGNRASGNGAVDCAGIDCTT